MEYREMWKCATLHISLTNSKNNTFKSIQILLEAAI